MRAHIRGAQTPPPRDQGSQVSREATSAELRCLLSYSPDLNPIEQLFAKRKAVH